ncbi:MAG: hypothetical protein QOJ70_586 [Acidobacteriota bacterium]|jgi:hypothetical protein|nr:hypothetical protein [Acidobacteriota bacterium]
MKRLTELVMKLLNELRKLSMVIQIEDLLELLGISLTAA